MITEADGSALALRDATPRAAIVREKRAANFRALAAIAGWAAYPTVDDHGNRAWLVTRGARTIELPSIDAAEAWLREQGD